MQHTFLATVLLLSCVPTARADGVRAFRAASATVQSEALGSRHRQNAGVETYLERWSFFLEREDGGWVQAAFILANMGPGDGHAGVDVKRFAPPLDRPEEDPVAQRWTDRAAGSDWAAAADAPRIAVGKNRLRPTPGGWSASLRTDEYEIEFEVTAQAAPWSAGNGRIDYRGDGSFTFHTLPTTGTFTARERVPGGAWRPFRGTVFGGHERLTLAPYRIADRWLRFHGRSGPFAVTFQEVFTPARYGKERFGWLVVTRDDQIVAQSLEARSVPTRFRRDREGPKHRVPRAYRIEAQTPDGPLRVEVRVTAPNYREDVLSAVPAFIRRVVELVMQPINYFDRAAFRVHMPDGARVSGRRAMSIFSAIRR